MGNWKTTWRELLGGEMKARRDPGPVIAYSPDEATFDIEFDPGYGLTEGPAMLAWTETRVYFPVAHDGSERVESAPRHPQPEGQPHI